MVAFFPLQAHARLSASALALSSFWMVLSVHVSKLNVSCHPDFNLKGISPDTLTTQYETAILSLYIMSPYFNFLHGIYLYHGCFVHLLFYGSYQFYLAKFRPPLPFLFPAHSPVLPVLQYFSSFYHHVLFSQLASLCAETGGGGVVSLPSASSGYCESVTSESFWPRSLRRVDPQSWITCFLAYAITLVLYSHLIVLHTPYTSAPSSFLSSVLVVNCLDCHFSNYPTNSSGLCSFHHTILASRHF